MTSREIARELGEGFTRNSVIGKTQRLGIWLGRPKPSEPEQLIEPEPVVEPAPIPTATIHHLKTKTRYQPPPQGPLKPTGNQAFLMALTSNMCRFPVSGDGERTLFCGDPTEKGIVVSGSSKACLLPQTGS